MSMNIHTSCYCQFSEVVFEWCIMLCSLKINMPKEKRKRSPNWLPSEKNLLLELVEKHFSIIENKKIDSVTMTQKLAEWQLISQEYNRQTKNSSRSAKILKNQWKSMKKNARQEEFYKKTRIQTDGEPENLIKENSIHSRIISLIKKGNSNHTDSNSGATDRPEKIFFTEVLLPEATSLPNPETDIEDIQETGVDSNEAVLEDWTDDDTPKLLRISDSIINKTNNNEQERKFKKNWIPRRRPTYQKSFAEKETLHLNEARELDLQIKRKQLKQEKIKTQILLIDLKLKKKQLLNER